MTQHSTALERQPAPRAAGAGPALALLAGRYPLRSETFVVREVEGLRARGWTVHPIALRPAGGEAAEDVAPAALVLYGAGTARLVASAAAEALRQPRRALSTLALALRDALAPGEPTGLASRAKLPAQALAALALAGWLRPRGVTHLHCHFAHAPATLGMYAAHQLAASFSFVGHANDLFQRRVLLRRKLERAAFVSCISEWHRHLYRTSADVPAARLALIRCGVDLARFGPAGPAAGAGPLRVLVVARLVEKKGIDVLIRALERAGREAQLDWRLRVAGDGPERARLEALAVELGCRGRVELLGATAPQRVPELLRDADVFALPCRTDRHGDRDGIPVSLIEAMASGLAVVAGDLPAIRELVNDGETGLLVPGGEVAALAQRLVELARAPELRRRLGAAARQQVAREFALADNLARLEAQLRALLRSAC